MNMALELIPFPHQKTKANLQIIRHFRFCSRITVHNSLNGYQLIKFELFPTDDQRAKPFTLIKSRKILRYSSSNLLA